MRESHYRSARVGTDGSYLGSGRGANRVHRPPQRLSDARDHRAVGRVPARQPALRLDHVGVQVADLAAAADWYCAAFELEREVELRVDAIDLDIVMLRSAEFGHRVEILHRPGSMPGLRGANPAVAALSECYTHIAFDVADLEATHARLVRLGAREVMDPQQSPERGVRMSYLTDLEGNLVELVERTPAR
jgi:lactoylglutathione lyase